MPNSLIKDLTKHLNYVSFFPTLKSTKLSQVRINVPLNLFNRSQKRLGLDVEIDRRLTERILSTNNLSDWFEKLRNTFEDIELKYEGGESSREAMNRIVEVVEEIFSRNNDHTVVVTHGNLMSLLFMFYNKDFGFDNWERLSNPDVFLLSKEGNQVTFKRIWD